MNILEYTKEENNLKPRIQNGCDIAKYRTWIYGVPQAGCFAYIKLAKHLADDCCLPTGHTPGLFCHLTQQATLNYVIDNFGT